MPIKLTCKISRTVDLKKASKYTVKSTIMLKLKRTVRNLTTYQFTRCSIVVVVFYRYAVAAAAAAAVAV